MGRFVIACCVVVAGCGFSVPGTTGGDDQMDPDAGTPGDWWDPAYAYRRQITVTSTTAAIPEAYSVMVSADTAALVTGGHARTNGKDWRVVWHKAAGMWMELDRWIDDAEGTQWNGTDTRTWFRLPVAMAEAATNGEVYVYYGAQSGNSPPEHLDRVFVFADDFEQGLSKWAPNGRGETVLADSTQHRGGAQSLRFDTGSTSAAGLHRDEMLPQATLLFSHYLRQMQTTASFGDTRGFDIPYAQRAPGWIDNALAVSAELDSNDQHQVWTVPTSSIVNWLQNVGTNVWRKIEIVDEGATNQVKARADGGTWTGKLPSGNAMGTQIRSLALEGEGQPGTFWLDNYIIRLYVEPEPTATLGPEQPLP